MDRYLSIPEAAEYLGVTEETIKRYISQGELPTYSFNRLIRIKQGDIDSLITKSFEILLTPGLRAAVSHVCPIREGSDAWRVMVRFVDTNIGGRPVVPFGLKVQTTEYKVYVTGEYLEDIARLPATVTGAEKFALRYIKDRFERTKNNEGDRDIKLISESEIFCYDGKCSTEPNKIFFPDK